MTIGDLIKTAIKRTSGKPHTTILSSRMIRLRSASRLVSCDYIHGIKVAGHQDVVKFLQNPRHAHAAITSNHINALLPLKWIIDTVYGGGGRAVFVLEPNGTAVKELLLGGIPAAADSMNLKENHLIGLIYRWNGTSFV